ncbi:SHOCT domain-containing protein [Microbacterium sp. NPDC078428]|uniref:SHOCT domain-containing protein n=1 Tax=Microbacterium sp. NPDC078428 TaxID=3364190 RepID=UPI0037CA4E67
MWGPALLALVLQMGAVLMQGPRRGGADGALRDIVGAILGFVFALAVLALVAVAIVYVVQRLRQLPAGPATVHASPTAPNAARALLDERYARGEIDDEEYTRRRALLEPAPRA